MELHRPAAALTPGPRARAALARSAADRAAAAVTAPLRDAPPRSWAGRRVSRVLHGAAYVSARAHGIRGAQSRRRGRLACGGA
eukprot:scaffold1104_cov299-Prasinococcus_capsulatus_cf.AAC.9